MSEKAVRRELERETGAKKNPSLATLRRITTALGVPVEQLLK